MSQQKGFLHLGRGLWPILVIALTPAAIWLIHANVSSPTPPPQSMQAVNGVPSGTCVPPLINIDINTSKFYLCGGDGQWHRAIPPGTIVMTLSACGAGWTELASMDGQFPQGTVAANADAGTTGGNATQTFTTAGNVSLLGVGTALTGPTTVNLSPPFTKIIFCQLP